GSGNLAGACNRGRRARNQGPRHRSIGGSAAKRWHVRRDGLRLWSRADAESRRRARGSLRSTVAGVGGARDGLRFGRLLQLRGAGQARRRTREPCSFLHQRPGVRRRGVGVGMMTPDLSVSIGSLTLPNPLIAASGCFGYGLEYEQVVDLSSLGGVVSKG